MCVCASGPLTRGGRRDFRSKIPPVFRPLTAVMKNVKSEINIRTYRFSAPPDAHAHPKQKLMKTKISSSRIDVQLGAAARSPHVDYTCTQNITCFFLFYTPRAAAGKVGANHPLLLIDPVLMSARRGRAGYVTGRRKTPLHLASAVVSRLLDL